MKSIKLLLSAVLLGAASLICSAWEPAGDRLMTQWGKQVNPGNAWQTYPRPQLKRAEWQNLNGLWDCAITAMDVQMKDVDFDREILVPFAVESSLSGVGAVFTPTDKLWYRRTFRIPSSWKGRNVVLHFGAVDYAASVYVNGKLAGTHVGGNNSFSLDITRLVKTSGENVLVLGVTDPTNESSCTRGKQTLKPGGIWYTAVSGIWKTVWMEPVASTSIFRVSPVSDITTGRVDFNLEMKGARGSETVLVKVFDGQNEVCSTECPANAVSAIIPSPVLWTPDTPKLYAVQLTLKRAGKVLDTAETYCALREVSKKDDGFGNVRFCLNGEPVFQWGPLDQGWWPDGLLTPPSEEAMIYDMVQLKKMGFNTIRKHIKVEPELYYYYADSLGIMLWQDMPAGFRTANAAAEHVSSSAPEDWDAPAEHEAQWKFEYAEMVDNLKFFPCITTWIIFNEGWGQFRTPQITEWAEGITYGRLLNSVTGWTDRGVGDYYDIHNYPSPSMMLKEECGGRISSLGEFGGLGFKVADHLWNEEKGGWGYREMTAQAQLITDFSRLMFDLKPLVSMGLSAAIYTQTTDVESEINGLMTYDREVIKISPALLHAFAGELYGAVPEKSSTVVARNADSRIKTIAPKSKTTWKEEFNWDSGATGLGLWLFTECTTSVRINGVEVFNGPMRARRHYNHVNLSDYINVLHKGSNTIEFELENISPKAETKFDFAITKF